MLKNPVIPIFAGLLGLLAFLFSAKSGEEAMVDNMLPELIGFCLEGIFFVGIFGWLQDRKDRERKREMKQSLAGALGFLCPVINSFFSEADRVSLPEGDNWNRQVRLNGTQLVELLARLSNAEFSASENEISAMQQLLSTRLSTIDSLLPVAAQLSHSHLSAYSMILTEIHKITEHRHFNEDELKRSFIMLMRLLTGFNNEEI